MVSINFKPRSEDPSWRPGWLPERDDGELGDLAELTASDFSLRYFQVDAFLSIDDTDFSRRGLGTPLLDFVLMLELARFELESVGASTVEASLSQESLSFALMGEAVRVTSNYTEGVAWTTYDEFAAAVYLAYSSATLLLLSVHPGLRQNVYLQSLGRRMGWR